MEPILKDDDPRARPAVMPGAETTVLYKDRGRRSVGWRSKDVLRTASLVIAMYLGLRLLWFANPLFLTAFIGVLFGLAVSSGVDRLNRWRMPRGIGAALVVLTFIGALIGFGAWVAPTIRAQSIELRKMLLAIQVSSPGKKNPSGSFILKQAPPGAQKPPNRSGGSCGVE